jgi:hypothetical protein
MLQDNLFDPILNRVKMETIAERHRKLKRKPTLADDSDGWNFKNLNLQNWSKSQKLLLTDDTKEYFRYFFLS